MKATKRSLVQVGDKFVLVSSTAVKVLNHLKAQEYACNYESIVKGCKIKKQSLYVFCQRLEKAGLVARDRVEGVIVVRLLPCKFVDFISIGS